MNPPRYQRPDSERDEDGEGGSNDSAGSGARSATSSNPEHGLAGRLIREKLREVELVFRPNHTERNIRPTIFQIPHESRVVKPGQFMYRPTSTRFGLYERGDLQAPDAIDNRRLGCVTMFLHVVNRTRTHPLDWDELRMRVVPNPAEIKLYYQEAPSMSDEDVRNLLTIDAVYLMILFQNVQSERTDFHFEQSEFINLVATGIFNDLVFVENQIPLVLLRNVFNIMTERRRTDPRRRTDAEDRSSQVEFNELLSNVVKRLVDNWGFFRSPPALSFHEESDHLLHCLYRAVCPDETLGNSMSEPPQIPTVSQLAKAGIKFKGFIGPLTDYKFERGFIEDTVWLPQIEVKHGTFPKLRNFAFFEMLMLSYMEGTPLLEYVFLMASLINSKEDVAILSKGGEHAVIYRNRLGDDLTVSELWNHMSEGLWRPSYSQNFIEFCQCLKNSYGNKHRRTFWEFVETYLNKPWKIASLLAAFVLLVLTFLQTFFTIYVYYKPSNPSGP